MFCAVGLRPAGRGVRAQHSQGQYDVDFGIEKERVERGLHARGAPIAGQGLVRRKRDGVIGANQPRNLVAEPVESRRILARAVEADADDEGRTLSLGKRALRTEYRNGD